VLNKITRSVLFVLLYSSIPVCAMEQGEAMQLYGKRSEWEKSALTNYRLDTDVKVFHLQEQQHAQLMSIINTSKPNGGFGQPQDVFSALDSAKITETLKNHTVYKHRQKDGVTMQEAYCGQEQKPFIVTRGDGEEYSLLKTEGSYLYLDDKPQWPDNSFNVGLSQAWKSSMKIEVQGEGPLENSVITRVSGVTKRGTALESYDTWTKQGDDYVLSSTTITDNGQSMTDYFLFPDAHGVPTMVISLARVGSGYQLVVKQILRFEPNAELRDEDLDLPPLPGKTTVIDSRGGTEKVFRLSEIARK